jgi:opine dehydrogenase
VVIVAVVAQRHGEMAEVCAPHLHSGQTVLITPGNAGSLVFADTLKKRGMKSRPLLAEVEGSLCANRLVGDGEVMILFSIRTKYIAAFPGRETEKAVEALSGLYETRPAANVFEAVLNSPNVDVHLLGSLLNAGAIDRSGGEYCLYRQGITPSVVKAVEALHEEKAGLFRTLGYQDRSKPDLLVKLLQPEGVPELALLRNAAGPSSLRHRYVDEDAYAGISLMVSLGELVNQPLPIARGILALASAINGVDYANTGRTLKNLGLAGLTVEELNRRLESGEDLST